MKFAYTTATLLSAATTTVLAAPTKPTTKPFFNPTTKPWFTNDNIPTTKPFFKRTPPSIPSPSEATSLLESLTITTQEDDGSYDRDLFPHWEKVADGECDARDYVIRRDGSDVEVDSDCDATSGSWVSPYDGGEWTDASDLDIDHMVPLKNAWISGASEWTTSDREAFANDIDSPQLWAVTDEVNASKSDRSPEEWLPPLESFYCTYASAWVAVKDKYDLTVTQGEADALADMLGSC